MQTRPIGGTVRPAEGREECGFISTGAVEGLLMNLEHFSPPGSHVTGPVDLSATWPDSLEVDDR